MRTRQLARHFERLSLARIDARRINSHAPPRAIHPAAPSRRFEVLITIRVLSLNQHDVNLSTGGHLAFVVLRLHLPKSAIEVTAMMALSVHELSPTIASTEDADPAVFCCAAPRAGLALLMIISYRFVT